MVIDYTYFKLLFKKIFFLNIIFKIIYIIITKLYIEEVNMGDNI